jgi:hypothetical protein
MAFLDDLEPRPLTQGKLPEGCKPVEYFLTDKSAAEVAVFQFNRRPTQAAVRECWKEREKGRAVPVLAVFLHGSYVTLCGPVITHNTGHPPIYFDLPVERAQTVCREFLNQPNNEAAVKFVREALPQMVSAVPGLRNEGMFSSHYLHERVSGTAHYTPASQRAAAVVNLRERQLLQGLGFEIEETNQNYLLLKTGGRKQAVAVLVREDEMPDRPATRFADLSPAAYALNKAQDNGCPWVVTMQGDKLRLYSTDGERPVASKGRTETFAEINLALIEEQHQPFLWLLFSAEALRPDGTVDYILNESSRFAVDVRVKLRDRIYTAVIPRLAQGLAAARGLKRMNAGQLRETYDAALVLLFRLLFVAYAEDKDLLPYLESQAYRKKSIKGLAQDLVEERLKNATYHKDAGTGTWKDVQRVFHAIREGDKALSVPAYNGGLFDKTRPEGQVIDSVELPDSVFRAALSTLLVDDTRDGIPGPVDFSAIGVREFGTIYEGLLLSELGQAEEDLTSDAEGRYRPVSKKTDAVIVAKGDFYLHNASGARKASGSYYTPEFAVAHLLRGALNPALEEHFQRLDTLPEAEAGKRFFDFRVSDIAMGSGHFLVSAVDFIEAGMSRYLERRPLPAVKAELESLRKAAEAGLAQVGVQRRVDGSQLLRRMIARRCIYGVDYNRTAVELSRLALWIHTFVPGLPLSFLDRTLRHGNSLAGIERVAEAEELLKDGGFGFTGELKKYLKLVAGDLEKLRALTDSSVQDIAQAKRLDEQIQQKLAPATAIFDVLTAARLDEGCQQAVEGGELSLLLGKGDAAIPGSKLHKQALKALEGLHVLHFPAAFPEVFFGDNPGFDVILGNPPWEEATIEELKFWVRYQPGMNGLSAAQQKKQAEKLRGERPDLVKRFEAEQESAEAMRVILTSGAFPGMGTGDPDLYKGFCWRFWRLCRPEGRLGVVVPRSVWCSGGSEEFRKAVLADGAVEELTFLLNNRNWFFPDVHPQYTVALSVLRRAPGTVVRFRGPYSSLERFRAGTAGEPPAVPVAEFLTWTETAAFPLLPSDDSLEPFLQLRKAPRLDLDDKTSWRARPQAELHATNEVKKGPALGKFVERRPKGHIPVFTGGSFDIWQPDRGESSYYAWANPKKVYAYLQDKRARAARNSASAFSEMPAAWVKDKKTLPALHPRIAFRDVTNRTNNRTVIAALVPPEAVIVNAAPYAVWPRGDEKDQAFLLGVLCSVPLDWFARRWVEIHMNFHIFNALPIPRPERTHPLWQRVVALAGRLAAVDDRYQGWAQAVGVDCGTLDDRTRQGHIHELDAAVALLYGLTEEHLTHIFETFHEGKIEGQPYQQRLTPVLAHYRRLKSPA